MHRTELNFFLRKNIFLFSLSHCTTSSFESVCWNDIKEQGSLCLYTTPTHNRLEFSIFVDFPSLSIRSALDARATEHVLGLPAHSLRLDRRSSVGSEARVLFLRSRKVNKKKKDEGRKIDERMHEASVERGHWNFFLCFYLFFLAFSLDFWLARKSYLFDCSF